MRRSLATAFVCLMSSAAALATAGDARGDGSSDLTLGLGAGIGIHKAGGPDEKASTALMNQANLRLKFLQVFGIDYALDLGRDDKLVNPADDELHYQAKMRLTALIYPYNGEAVAFYFGAGIGGGKLAELLKTNAVANSYHAGIGFEFHLGDHLSIDTSFMLVAPGSRSVENVAVARVEAALAAGDNNAINKLSAPGLDDFISLKNHEFMIRLFLFL